MSKLERIGIIPCPFCGSKEIEYQYLTEDREGIPCRVICEDCGATGPTIYIKHGQEALVLMEWNKRINSNGE